MALPQRSRSALATVVGWLLVAVVVWVLFGFLVGTLRAVLRGALWLVVLVGLLVAYLALKAPPDD